MKNLAENIKAPFSKLSFEEKAHQYKVDSVPIKKSVSGLVHTFVPHTDFDAIAPFSAKKAGVSTEEIKRQWKEKNDESKERGHRVHAFGELYPFDRSLKPSCPQEEAVVKFWQELPEYIIPVVMELRMFHFVKLFAGTADIILFNTKTQSYIIADYKTNADLFKNFKGKTLLAPFEQLLDCPMNHYAIQLSYYQILLEQIGIKVEQRTIIWLNLEGNYEMFNMADLTEHLN